MRHLLKICGPYKHHICGTVNFFTSRPTTASRPSTPLNPSPLAPLIRLCWPLCAFINYIYLLLTYLQICGNHWVIYSMEWAFWRKLSPTLASAHYSCPDNAIGLDWQAVGRKFFYYYQCLCRSNVMHNPHKLNIDWNRNTNNIKIIKIAVENSNLRGKKYSICALLV